MQSDANKPTLPFDPSAFGKIKLGKGISGKISYLIAFTIVGLFCIGGLLITVGLPFYGMSLALLAVAVAGLGILKISNFAEKNPELALLEGAEYVRLQEIKQAAKEPITIDVSAEPTANTAPPQSITFGGNGG